MDGETVGLATLSKGTHSSREYSKFRRVVNRYVEPDPRNEGHGAAAPERSERDSLAAKRRGPSLTTAARRAATGG
ncbi:hypothetical protein GCM10009039_13820 [Halocalculus aciditolerans]|uniref:Uncharacterized protein n=1 Tax=Halocalculus aciditolerans TaxID=1383812 RepID=A0A830F5M0_9EURY|nr:hypothetical protein GCM10009039_13820 [Halocalculus aciditolerans]